LPRQADKGQTGADLMNQQWWIKPLQTLIKINESALRLRTGFGKKTAAISDRLTRSRTDKQDIV
jgi:hypothetical protein